MDPTGARPTDDSATSRAYQPGRYWVSAWNFESEVQGGYAFPKPLVIFDGTLRKILLTPGLRPSVDDILFIAEALEEVGIREVFLNVHWWGDATPEVLEYEVCRALLSRNFTFRTTVSSDMFVPEFLHGAEHLPNTGQQAIAALRDSGMSIMNVLMHDPRDEAARKRELEQLLEVFSYARSLGVSCAVALPDVGRMDFEYAVRVANAAIDLGTIRVDLLDSNTSLSPEAMKVFVTRFRSRLTAPMPMTMHVHNDFGMATATAIAAASAGADPDVAVNGLSYRAGFPALEEVAVSLEVVYGVPTGLRLDRLQHLCDIVAARTGLPNHPLKAIAGAHAFIYDTPGPMTRYLKGGPDVFPPPGPCFAPSVVGGRMQVVWGNHHSDAVIRAKLYQMGLNASEAQVLEIRGRIERSVQALKSYPRWLTEKDVEAICKAVVA